MLKSSFGLTFPVIYNDKFYTDSFSFLSNHGMLLNKANRMQILLKTLSDLRKYIHYYTSFNY